MVACCLSHPSYPDFFFIIYIYIAELLDVDDDRGLLDFVLDLEVLL